MISTNQLRRCLYTFLDIWILNWFLHLIFILFKFRLLPLCWSNRLIKFKYRLLILMQDIGDHNSTFRLRRKWIWASSLLLVRWRCKVLASRRCVEFVTWLLCAMDICFRQECLVLDLITSVHKVLGRSDWLGTLMKWKRKLVPRYELVFAFPRWILLCFRFFLLSVVFFAIICTGS